jgi:chlorite dismutase
MQFQAYTGCLAPGELAQALKQSGLESVLYLDLQDPRGVGILLMSEDPADFTGRVRDFLNAPPFRGLTPKPGMTMTGRTYSSGREANLEDWLLRKPRRSVLNPAWPWAVWYPLRRKPEFELLSKEEQSAILFEHARIGMSYGQADFAHDIRLACHGLDQNDNEFVIGLAGRELYPLSRLVQDMRKTQQTARYIQSLGPFFVGKALFQSPLPE